MLYVIIAVSQVSSRFVVEGRPQRDMMLRDDRLVLRVMDWDQWGRGRMDRQLTCEIQAHQSISDVALHQPGVARDELQATGLHSHGCSIRTHLLSYIYYWCYRRCFFILHCIYGREEGIGMVYDAKFAVKALWHTTKSYAYFLPPPAVFSHTNPPPFEYYLDQPPAIELTSGQLPPAVSAMSRLPLLPLLIVLATQPYAALAHGYIKEWTVNNVTALAQKQALPDTAFRSCPDNTGFVGSDYITNVAVTCSSSVTPFNITSPPSGLVFSDPSQAAGITMNTVSSTFTFSPRPSPSRPPHIGDSLSTFWANDC